MPETPTPDDRRPPRDLALLGFLSAALAAVVFVGGIYWMSVLQARAQDLITHTYEVLEAVATTRADLVDIQNGVRGYVITGLPQDLAPYESGRAAIGGDLRRLHELTADNPPQQHNVGRLESALEPRLASAAAVIAARREGGAAATRTLMDSDVPAQVAKLRDILQDMAREESHLLSARLTEHHERLGAFWAGIAALLVVLLATLAAIYLQHRRAREAEQRLLESERKFHLMTDSVSDYAILMLDADGRVQTWNAGAQQIKGYAAGEIVGQPIDVFYTPEDRAEGKPRNALATAVREGHYTEYGWRVRKDGTRFWASVVITPLKDVLGRVEGFCKITRDMTEAKRAQEAERAREMAAKLITAQEEERRHVARELHDETGQSLTLILMNLSELKNQPGPAGAVAAKCTQVVERASAHIRSLSLRLRPPMLDDLGLPDALEWLLDQQASAAGWRWNLEVPEIEERLPKEVETTLFRIAQEALTNAARYSGATEVRLSLRLDGDAARLEVCDNGSGFDLGRYTSAEERKKHFGLVSMAERAEVAGGDLEIDTAPGRGTTIRASVPALV
jgi:PAS domain S-box-containing protein